MKIMCKGFIILIVASAILYAQPPTTPSEDNKQEQKESVSTPEAEKEPTPVNTTEKDSEKSDVEKESSPQDSATAKKAGADADTVVKKDTAVAEKESVKSKDTTASKDTVGVAVSGDSTGVLTIVTVPESAFVIFDEALKGKSPITIKDIPVGRHTIVLKKKGCFAKKATVNVTAGSENELNFELAKPVELTVSSEPAGASVLLNKKDVGTTPFTDSKLKPGTYDIALALEGYKQEQHTVALGSGERDSMHVTLVPLSKVSEDTISAVKDKKAKKEKSKLSSILDKVALAVFISFSLVILLIELTQDK